MADVVYTPGNVQSKSYATNRPPLNATIGGSAITAGGGVKIETDGTLSPANTAAAGCDGIALASGQPGQTIPYQDNGSIAYGSGLTQGEVYVASDAGGLAPASDLGTGDYTIILGVAQDASILLLNLFDSGVARP